MAPGPHVHLALTFQSQEIQWLLSLLLRVPGRLDEAGESVSRPGALGLFLGLILQLAAGPSQRLTLTLTLGVSRGGAEASSHIPTSRRQAAPGRSDFGHT